VTSGTPGGDFGVSVPVGWTKFVEQRGRQAALPDSTAVRWVKSDGTAELMVERFADYAPRSVSTYIQAMEKADTSGTLFNALGTVDEHLFRTGQTGRSIYFKVVTDNSDLWVLSVTVPTVQEDSGKANLYDKISPTFRVIS
jgi:hypothetical protein